MKKIFLYLITTMLPLISLAETDGNWKWADDVWTRAQQDLSPELSIGKFYSSETNAKFRIVLKMRNPFVRIQMPAENPRLLVKLTDGSIMELKGTPSDYQYVKPEISTSSSTPNKLYGDNSIAHIYNSYIKTSLQIRDVYYLIYSTTRFDVSDEEAVRLTSQPIVKWRVELADGKYIDYDIREEDAKTVQEEMRQAFDKVR